MNDPIDIHGVWWLPESPHHKVAGWLRYDTESGGELRLSGSIREPKWLERTQDGAVVQRVIAHTPLDQRPYPRIHGQSGHKVFHLEDCFQTHIEHYLCRDDDSAERIHVNWLLTGAWFDASEEIGFDRAVVGLQHLTDWVGHSGLEVDEALGPDVPFATVRANSLPPFRTVIDDACELDLRQGLSTSGDGRNDIALTQRWDFILRPTATQSLEYFTDRVSDFQDLLTIATGEVANIESFYFTRADVPAMSVAGTPLGRSKTKLGYHTRWTNRDDHKGQLSPYAMFFTFDDLGGIDGVQQWMQFADAYRSELSRVMATRYNDQMFLEDRVANCVAALESFDRTRRNVPHQQAYLTDRLKECASLAGAPFQEVLGGESIEDWAVRAKDHRHTLGHHLDRFRENTSIVEHHLADQVFWLATLCFLRESGAPEQLFEKVARHPRFRHLADRARSSRGPSSK